MNKKELLFTVLFASVVVFGFIFKLVIYPIFVANKTADTLYSVTDKVLNADNVIYNYEWFKTQYEAIEAQREKVNQSQEEHDVFKEALDKDSSKWTRFQQQEEASLRNSLSANEKMLTDLIAEYNAKSSMVNRSIFKGNLPSRLEK